MPKNLVRPGSAGDASQPYSRQQLADQYVTADRSNPTLATGLARWVIAAYTAPGDIVCDPNPGPGVVLAEAIRTGRHAYGLHTPSRRESALESNLELACHANSSGTATLLSGIDDPHAATLPNAVDLVLTGLRPAPTRSPSRELIELYEDLNAVVDWVWPGGHVVVICHPRRRRRDFLLDLPGKICDVAKAIGLLPVGHYIVLTTRVHGRHVTRQFAARTGNHPENTSIQRCATHPTHINVLAFSMPHGKRR
ncbi:DNA modification methylase [Haloechinothrix salitolerans]|uniref:DNA modification methylase n=1 Tax=Haloechinothrix salitolerans TaxID=926830 RepID=A0ABW2BVU5_9PSEU